MQENAPELRMLMPFCLQSIEQFIIQLDLNKFTVARCHFREPDSLAFSSDGVQISELLVAKFVDQS